MLIITNTLIFIFPLHRAYFVLNILVDALIDGHILITMGGYHHHILVVNAET